MPVTIHSVDPEASTAGNVIHLKVTGKLTKADYRTFLPEVEEWISRHGRIRILFDMVDFHGWTLSGKIPSWPSNTSRISSELHWSVKRRGNTAWRSSVALHFRRSQDFDHSIHDEAIEWVTG